MSSVIEAHMSLQQPDESARRSFVEVMSSCGRIETGKGKMICFLSDPAPLLVETCRGLGMKFEDPDLNLPEWPQIASPESPLVDFERCGEDFYHLDDWDEERKGGPPRWRSFLDICSEKSWAPKIYYYPSCHDVCQGQLGNCWLCAIISALSHQLPGALGNMISPNQPNEFGVYSIRFFVDGSPIYMIVDDRILCYSHGGRLDVHSRKDGEMYVGLIAKACAKWMIWELPGVMDFFHRAFTGSSTCEDYQWEHPHSPPGEHWGRPSEEEARARAKEILSCIGQWREGITVTTEPWRVCETGLVDCHAYSVLWYGVVEGHELIKLRNPWGQNGEWNGAWSDQAQEWETYPDVRKALEAAGVLVEFQNDGAFFMNFDDFMHYFWRLIHASPRDAYFEGKCADIPNWQEFKEDPSRLPKGYLDKYLGGYTSTPGPFSDLATAIAACIQDDEAGGVTQEALSRFTIRKGRDLRPSPSGETSWLKLDILAAQTEFMVGRGAMCFPKALSGGSADTRWELPKFMRMEVMPESPNVEVLLVASGNRKGWGEGDALTAFASPCRADFTFRTRVFGGFPAVEVHDTLMLNVNEWNEICLEITEHEATYWINGRRRATCTFQPGDLPTTTPFLGLYAFSCPYRVRCFDITEASS